MPRNGLTLLTPNGKIFCVKIQRTNNYLYLDNYVEIPHCQEADIHIDAGPRNPTSGWIYQGI
jgi:hypothetical protein